jgi:peptide deformylase
MAILKIARMGHPILLGVAEPVADPTAPEIRRLVADMAETMEDAGGVGLAAPQVHVPLRLFVWRTGAGDISALINPEIEPVGEEAETAWEGCLSIPGLRGAVRRAARLRFRGLDIAGNAIEGEASGLVARVMQHETDHLDGILYPMRMEDLSQFGFNEELARAAARAAAKEEA